MRHLISLMLILNSSGLIASSPVLAADIRIAPTLRPASGMIQLTAVKPQITQVLPQTCVHRGETITIEGSNFGAATGRSIDLLSGGASISTIASSLTSWGANSITVTVPNTIQLQDGQWYGVGIKQDGQAGWLSNVDKGFTLCASTQSATTTSPTTSTTSEPAASSSIENPTASPATPTTNLATPAASGSLLQAQFPPPPQDLPPPPPKEDKTIEANEVVVLSSNLQEAKTLQTQVQALGLGIKRRRVLKGLGFVVTVLRVPKENTSGNALLSLRTAMPKVWADVNHRYELQGTQTNAYARRLLGWQATSRCGVRVRIGVIDTNVDMQLPALHGHAITQHSFLAAGITAAPPDHGSAIASLLVATPQPSGLAGLVPDAQLYIANIFRDRGDKTIDTTAEWIVSALDWLVQQKVSVINLSLGGPRNLLVEAAVQQVLKQGIEVVAAAGNGGESGSPVYPAAQPGVVAVTAVDAQLSIYKHATHGSYITFSAPGVDIWTAAPGKDGVYVSGSSYAAPFVTAALAIVHQAKPKASWPVLIEKMEHSARDLGTAGKDPVYGWGLVQASGCRPSKHR